MEKNVLILNLERIRENEYKFSKKNVGNFK